MARSCWIDAGNDPDPAALRKHGITVPYLDARWVASKPKPLEYLKWVRSLKMSSVGLFLCDPWQWSGNGYPTDPVAWAEWAYDLVQHKCAPGTAGDFPRVDLNYERDDPDWLLAMFERWRAHSPRRTTAFVVQSNKATIYESIAADLNALRISVKPQCFTADMLRVESARETESWRQAGVFRVEPFLDAKQLGAWWEGSAFTQGRLP